LTRDRRAVEEQVLTELGPVVQPDAGPLQEGFHLWWNRAPALLVREESYWRVFIHGEDDSALMALQSIGRLHRIAVSEPTHDLAIALAKARAVLKRCGPFGAVMEVDAAITRALASVDVLALEAPR
jgi:hypothetical protein